jgi:hypothetical protein
MIISIDIGIQNLAFCIFQPVADELPRIVDWKVIDLITLDDHVSNLCKCTEVQKNGKPCFNKAFYQPPLPPSSLSSPLTPIHLCKRHAAQYCADHFFICAEDAQFEKKTKRKIIDMCNKDRMADDVDTKPPKPTDKKEVWVQYAKSKFKHRVLYPIGVEGDRKEEVDMIQIGRNIKSFFDSHQATPLISTVIIENQISPHMSSTQRLMGTTRMKMIQGMIMQYFLVRGDDSIRIEFVSSSHKLNQFRAGTASYLEIWGRLFPIDKLRAILSLSVGLKEGALYRAHKKQANQICNYLLSEAFSGDSDWSQWNSRHASHPKKDDLDDSFLQGLSYILCRPQIPFMSPK